MAAVSSYPQQVETNIYWNLLKDLDEDLKIQLVTRLKKSLYTKEVAKASVTDEAQKAYVVMLDKLKTYQAYPVGWDGEDAVPLTPQVVMNFNHLLEVIDKQLLVGLTIFPETNGTLLIDCTDKEAGISLGNDKFSYYIIKDGQVMGENGLDFSVQAITQVIEQSTSAYAKLSGKHPKTFLGV